jgi:hypothetical protein
VAVKGSGKARGTTGAGDTATATDCDCWVVMATVCPCWVC